MLLEASTRKLSNDEFFQFLASARARQDFTPIDADRYCTITFTRQTVPELVDYVIEEPSAIFLNHTTRQSWPHDSVAFWDLARCSGGQFGADMALDIVEASRHYDPSKARDLQLRFGYISTCPGLSLSIGGVSPASTDLAYRRDLFNRFLRALGLSEQLETLIVEGELDIRVHDQRFRNAKDSPRNILPQLRSSATLLYEGGCTNTKGRDFRDLRLYCFTLDELEQKVPDVVQALGGESRIVASRLGLGCTTALYQQIRDILNVSPFKPWTISLTAIGKYNLSSLEQAIAENDSFLFRLFGLNPPSVGYVDVEIHFADGAFSLHFYANYESNEQERALHDLIIQLAGGEDIIDHALL